MIAERIGLTEDEFMKHFHELTVGWELNDEGRLMYVPMAQVAAEILEIHGKELMGLRARAIAVTADPQAFDLTGKAPAKTRGNTMLPKDFQPSEATIKSMEDDGFTTLKRQEWLIAKFTSHFQSTGEMKRNWQQTLVNFAKKEPSYTRPWNQRDSHWTEPGFEPVKSLQSAQIKSGSPFSRFVTSKDAVRSHNQAAFGINPSSTVDEMSAFRQSPGN